MAAIYVGNIPYDVTEREISAIFEPFGVVDRVALIGNSETGQSRGFCFVEMHNSAAAATAAEAINGIVFRGRKLSVCDSVVPPEHGIHETYDHPTAEHI